MLTRKSCYNMVSEHVPVELSSAPALQQPIAPLASALQQPIAPSAPALQQPIAPSVSSPCGPSRVPTAHRLTGSVPVADPPPSPLLSTPMLPPEPAPAPDPAGTSSVEVPAPAEPPAPPRTRLQDGIRKLKLYTDGTVRYAFVSSSCEPYNL
jgi:hypothetical protein